MSSDFSINEFRRNRAGGEDAAEREGPSVPAIAPMPLPTFDGLQEYVPDTASAPMQDYASAMQSQSTMIPDAVPANPYAHAAPASPVIDPVHVPMPATLMAPSTIVSAPTPAIATLKKAKSSLMAGLLSKVKKPNKASEPAMVAAAPAGPVEYSAADIGSSFTPTPALQVQPVQAQPQAPVANSVPSFMASVPVEITARTKSGLPSWAAFALGIMTGIILTFAILAITANKSENTLEARHGPGTEKVQQSAHASTETETPLTEASSKL